MLPATGGTFGVGRLEKNASSSPSKLLSRFKGTVEGNNGNWSLALDANCFSLKTSDDEVRRASLNGRLGGYMLTVLKHISREAEVYAGLRLGKCPLMAEPDVRWHAPE
jgi:hypothetical protein